jgi:hypothetical protein
MKALNPEFKRGQKVLCVNDHYTSYSLQPVKKGSIYTIHDLYQCTCGSRQLTLMEFPIVTNMGCKCSRISFRRHAYYEWRFIPLTYFEKFIKASTVTKEISEEINAQNKELLQELVKELSLT